VGTITSGDSEEHASFGWAGTRTLKWRAMLTDDCNLSTQISIVLTAIPATAARFDFALVDHNDVEVRRENDSQPITLLLDWVGERYLARCRDGTTDVWSEQ
jgi:hypothetical protein